MPVVIVTRAAAAPYPGEVPVPVHEAGVAVVEPGLRPGPAGSDTQPGPYIDALAAEHDQEFEPDAAERSCSETTKAGTPCKGRAGDDGLCAAHKKAAASA